MSKCNDIDKILERNGTNQQLTYDQSLDPNNLEIQDFDQTDWILFAYNLAQKINFFEASSNALPVSNWQTFFKAFGFTQTNIPARNSREYFKIQEAIKKTILKHQEDSSLTPHLCLFTCFLHLLEHSKKRINGIAPRHLDYYFKDILQEEKLPAQPDQAHVLFTLAKKTTEFKVNKNAALNAKKDSQGNQRVFETKDEIIVNQSSIVETKTCYNDINKGEFKISPIAKTLDGIKEELPKESPFWLPFGYTSEEKNFLELPAAKMGFTLASPILKMSEGKRLIYIKIDFKTEEIKEETKDIIIKKALNTLPDLSLFSIECTGTKKWFNASLLATANNKDNWSTSFTDSALNLLIELPLEMEAFDDYQEDVYMEGYPTNNPMVRVNINTETTSGYRLFQKLSKLTIERITVDVDVQGKKNIEIQNDFGKIKATKPFYPFTPNPNKDSNFSIYTEEIFSKKWTNITVNLKWKNAPESLKNLYLAYGKNIEDNSFKATISNLNKKQWEEEIEGFNLFSTIKDEANTYLHQNFQFGIINKGHHYAPNQSGPIKMTLNQSFLQEAYPILLASDLNDKFNGKTIPHTLFEPYIPIAEEISLNYSAQETLSFQSQTLPLSTSNPLLHSNSKEAYANKGITLMHEYPFGFKEEHGYLLTTLRENGVVSKEDLNVTSSSIVPKFCHGGNLYIGLKDTKPLDNVSMLIQVLEGTENPMVESFEEYEKIEWSVLCSNKWKYLTDEIISNSTDNFLKSGILQIQVPKLATLDNTLLSPGLIWVKASMHKSYDAVCKVLDIHTNAVPSKFVLETEYADHLQNGLAQGSISKLMERVPQIKSVEQPYSSFDGKDKESEIEFYRRVSERLRHKDRAITLWDYERLILQKFREIFKVKCLNHTELASESNPTNNFFAPGKVTIIVVPDTKNRNVFDIYQPRVSKGLLNQVQRFITDRTSSLIQAQVTNATYEEVKVKLEVEFHEGKDVNYYQKELSKDITKFLSPWAFDSSVEIQFDLIINHSVLVSYIEKLDYVDYIQNIQLFKDNIIQIKEVKPTHPASILVSAKEHEVEIVLTNCKGRKLNNEVQCNS